MNVVLDQETKLFSVSIKFGVNNSSMKLSNIVEQTGKVKMVCFTGEMHFKYKHIHVWYIMVPTFLTGLSVCSSTH
jgi:hypothetical protein